MKFLGILLLLTIGVVAGAGAVIYLSDESPEDILDRGREFLQGQSEPTLPPAQPPAPTIPVVTPMPSQNTPRPLPTPTLTPIPQVLGTQTAATPVPTLPPPAVTAIPTILSEYSGAFWTPAAAGNYTPSTPRTINYIVIHAMSGSFNGTINWFGNPNPPQVSAHYLVGRDGQIMQMVREKDIAHHATVYNAESIGMELEDGSDGAYLQNPGWATDAMYHATAELVSYLSDKYGVPRDRQHIIGHDEVPTSDKQDPGPYWDWARLSTLAGIQSPHAQPPALPPAPPAQAACWTTNSLSNTELANLVRQHFPDSVVPQTGENIRVTAYAVAKAESGGNPSACGDNNQSIGIWQIHMPAHPQYSRGRLFESDYNANAAVQISSNGQNWNPWCTWERTACSGNGDERYEGWLDEARSVFGVGAPPTTNPPSPPSTQTATNLSEYYTACGKSLPSLNTRAQIYQALGLGSASSYTGTAAQNTALLNELKARQICPATASDVGSSEGTFPGQNATNLSEYYTACGKSLPSLSTRAQIYQALGLGSASSYAGTSGQNATLLNELKARRICPSSAAEV